MNQVKKEQTFSKSLIFSLCILLLCLLAMNFSFFHFSEDVENLQNQNDALIQKEKILVRMGEIPLYFEKNKGQTNENVKYLTKGEGYTFYFTPQSIVVALQKMGKEDQVSLAILKMEFVAAAQDPFIRGIEKQIYKTHYFIGNEPSQWHMNVPNFAKVCYEELYPGINAVFYGNKQQLEYDLCVAPGSNPQEIRLRLEGVKQLSLDLTGNLHIQAEDEQEVLMHKPIVYQMLEGEKKFLEGNFVLLANNEVGFALGDYDLTRELIIDPVLEYSTYLGGVGTTIANAIAVDKSGNAYVTGSTTSTNFPTARGAFQTSFGGVADVFVTKVNAAGSGLVYSTYLGGSGNDQANGIAIDSIGNAYVTGSTTSINYPITVNAFQRFLNGPTDAFVTRLNAAGSALIYSTYFGGSFNEIGFGIAVDSDQSAYVGGFTSSPDFPTTPGVFQETINGIASSFVAKFDLFGNLLYSTYFGGTTTQQALSIAVDHYQSVYITGSTTSIDFPTTSNAFQTAYGGGIANAFVAKFNSSATELIYSTYLGGSGSEQGNHIALDNDNHLYVVGGTSSPDFPVTAGAFQTYSSTLSPNGFVTKLDISQTSLVYSTLLGGSNGGTGARGVVVDNEGNAYVTGSTTSNNFPITADAFQSAISEQNTAFVAMFNSAGSDLIYSTYLGGDSGTGNSISNGIALDSSNNFYVAGRTTSSTFPTTRAFQTLLAGPINAFVTKFGLLISTISTVYPPSELTGYKMNMFHKHKSIINILNWKPPTAGSIPIEYRIYRDQEQTRLIAIVPGNQKLQFADHNRKKGKTYTYWIVSVDDRGNVSVPAIVTIH